MSLYYYFGIIREIFWSTGLRPDDHPEELPAIDLDWPTRLSLLTCAIMLIALGLFPEPLLHWAKEATSVFR